MPWPPEFSHLRAGDGAFVPLLPSATGSGLLPRGLSPWTLSFPCMWVPAARRAFRGRVCHPVHTSVLDFWPPEAQGSTSLLFSAA